MTHLRAFEDFTPGDTLALAPCTITKAMMVDFAKEFDPQAFHLDDSAGKESMLGGLAASGWHTCALFMRMMCDGWLLQSTSHGSPGIETARWLAPVLPGDRLQGTSTVLDKRVLAKMPAYGLVRFRHVVENAGGDTVLEMVNPIIFRRRDVPA